MYIRIIQNQVVTSSGNIEETRQRELVNIRDELETIRNRPLQIPNLQIIDTRDTILFEVLKRTS